MPNHVQNYLYITAPTAQRLQEVFTFIKGEEEFIDFNAIIKTPKEIENIEHCIETTLAEEIVKKEKGKKIGEYFNEKINNLTAEQQEQIQPYIDNVRKYGHADWYHWRLENWGTKWNAYEQRRLSLENPQSDDTIDTLMFQTAWTTPHPVIEHLSKLFPDCSFDVEYADEDLGCENCGTYHYNGGLLEYEAPDDCFRFACEIWGYDPDRENDEEDDEEDDNE